MPIDASIYGQIQQPKPVNQLQLYADAMKIQGAQQDQQLNRLKIDSAQRELDDTNALNRVYASAIGADGKINRNSLIAAAASANLGAHIPKIQKALDDADASRVKVDADQFELANKRYGLFQRTMGALAQDPQLTREKVLEAGQSLVSQGLLPAEMYQKTAATLPDDPQQIRTRLVQGLATQLTSDEIFKTFAPKPEKVDNGQTISFRDTNPNSPTYGQPTAGAAVQKQVSPDAQLTDNRTRSEGAANRAVTIRGQDKVDQRARDTNAIQAGQKTQQGVIELRKEFNALPEVKNFREVLPIIESVQRAPDTPAGDIDLIYGVGKVMDPNSVVREGEMNLVIKSGSPAQRLAGFYNYVKGGGRLSAAQRTELMTVMNSRVSGLKANFDNARKTYETAAERGGLPKEQIFIDNPVPAKTVDFASMPTGGGKVVDFGSLK